MIRSAVFGLTLLLTSSAVTAVSDKPAIRSFPIAAAERIYYTGAGTLQVQQGADCAMEVSATPAILDEIIIENYDDVVFIEVPDTLAETVAVVVTLPHVREIVTSGMNTVIGSGLAASDLSLEAKGAGKFNFSALKADELLVTGTDGAAFTLSGSVGRQVLDLADHELYQAGSLQSRSVEATVRGSGYILLAVDELLDINLAGAASVRYLGSPFVSQTVSGPGSIAPVTANSI